MKTLFVGFALLLSITSYANETSMPKYLEIKCEGGTVIVMNKGIVSFDTSNYDEFPVEDFLGKMTSLSLNENEVSLRAETKGWEAVKVFNFKMNLRNREMSISQSEIETRKGGFDCGEISVITKY